MDDNGKRRGHLGRDGDTAEVVMGPQGTAHTHTHTRIKPTFRCLWFFCCMLRASPCVAVMIQVQAAIGAKKAVAFDLTAACSGFVLAMVTAAQYVRTGMAKHVLVIGADAMSRLVDWRDRGA